MASSPIRRRSRRNDHEDHEDHEDHDEEDLSRAELQQVRNILSYTRAMLAFFGVITLISGIVTLAKDSGAEPAWLPMTTTAVGAIEILGAILLHRAPVPWIILTAAVSGFSIYGQIIAAPDHRVSLFTKLFMICTIGLIVAIPVVQKAMRALSHLSKQERLDRLRGRFRSSSRESDIRQRHSASARAESSKTMLRFGGAVAAAIALAVVGLRVAAASTKPAPIDPFIAKFESAFEAGEFDRARTMCEETYSTQRWPRVMKILRREEWDSGVELGIARKAPRGSEAFQVTFDLPRGELKTGWRWAQGSWLVSRVVFSHVR